ncbi:LysR family transcriptional regulator [Silvimonas iriomotensis]|uniref:LysR family transcriptional regulator n=1 Tax=Silvimonas iriomotensis TaxID=449662 RepID=A0ABQ2P4H5_9NEIS|nr:LysR family transcriptional regulator [Silvimonas iriomotensis]GGP18139.1 LysR family transcriptional regulator [Silvimonas iriomotensis]
MKTFVRVAEAGSFSAVAGEAGMTQSAVSKQVAALERDLGARLFSRTTRSLSLTEEGQRYFEQVRRLVVEIEGAEETLRQGTGQIQGLIRIAAPVGFGRLKLMPLVQMFMAKHPGLKVDLQLHDGFIDLVEQGIDVSIRIGELADSGLVARRVGTSHRLLVAHRDYLRQLPHGLAAPTSPQDLGKHNCLIYTGLSTRNLWRFTAAAGATAPEGTSQSVAVQGCLQTNSSEVMRFAILSGMGIGYVPDWLLGPELQSGEIARLMTDWHPPASPIHLVSPPERRHAARVRAFGDFVADAF